MSFTYVRCPVCGIPGGVVKHATMDTNGRQIVYPRRDASVRICSCTQCHAVMAATYTLPVDKRRSPVFKSFKVIRAKVNMIGPDR
jgi:heterodisulfide reductase subunit B